MKTIVWKIEKVIKKPLNSPFTMNCDFLDLNHFPKFKPSNLVIVCAKFLKWMINDNKIVNIKCKIQAKVTKISRAAIWWIYRPTIITPPPPRISGYKIDSNSKTIYPINSADQSVLRVAWSTATQTNQDIIMIIKHFYQGHKTHSLSFDICDLIRQLSLA